MIARVDNIAVPILLVAATLSIIGCDTPQGARPIPNGSAAFASYDEPWQKDLLRSAPPVYPYADRAAWRQGRGLFHVVLDAGTGAVVQATVKKSTGYATLDAAAISALKQWRFRPGSWKTLDIPVDFRMASSRAAYPHTVRQFQEQQRQL